MENQFESAVIGNITTRAVETNLSGHPVPAHIGQIFLGHTANDSEALIVDGGADATPGLAFRRYLGPIADPAMVTSGTQLGYFDFRGFSGAQMWNSASIDAVIDGAVAFEDGDWPPAKMRFLTAEGDAGAASRMEITAPGCVSIGTADGNAFASPGALGSPKLYINQSDGENAAILAAHSASGANYGLRLHTIGAVESDWLLACSSGTVSGSFKCRVLGNGDVDLSGVVKIDGTQVLGEQRAPVADAVDAASLVAQLNMLLDRLRAHGLIEA